PRHQGADQRADHHDQQHRGGGEAQRVPHYVGEVEDDALVALEGKTVLEYRAAGAAERVDHRDDDGQRATQCDGVDGHVGHKVAPAAQADLDRLVDEVAV